MIPDPPLTRKETGLPTALIYHDIVPRGEHSTSGFSGPDADIYKLTPDVFEDHLARLEAINKVQWLRSIEESFALTDVLLTFDDGGVGAWPLTARLLESRGWRGHFFIPTARIGTPGFLDAQGVRALHEAGHIVGSHSHNHPARMTHCTPAELDSEWEVSASILEDILGMRPFTASVPAGYYDRRVGEAAAKAGFKVLFTSEPVRAEHRLLGCRIIGRFSIQAATPASVVAAFARGQFRVRANQWVWWNAKKLAKRIGGEKWLRFRERWFAN